MAPATSGRLFVSEGRNVLDAAWNASGATIAVAVEDDRLVGLWGMDSSGVRTASDRVDAHIKCEDVVNACAWHPSRDEQLAIVMPSRVRLYDVRTCKPTAAAPATDKAAPVAAAWAPDGQSLVVHSQREDMDFLALVDVRKNKAVRTYRSYDEVGDVAFTHDGQQLLAAIGHGVALLDVPQMALATTYVGHTAKCVSVAASPDDRNIASGGSDAVVALWDLEAGVCTRTFTALDRPARRCAFSSDGSFLAFTAEGQGLQVVDLAAGSSATGGRGSSAGLVLDTTRRSGALGPRPSTCAAWHPRAPVVAYAETLPPSMQGRGGSHVVFHNVATGTSGRS